MSRFSKQIIISISDTIQLRYAETKKAFFEAEKEQSSSIIITVPFSLEALSHALLDFRLEEKDNLRVIVLGHGAPGCDYIASLTENMQGIREKYSVDYIVDLIDQIFLLTARPKNLPFSISLTGCYLGLDTYICLGLIKYPSFANRLQIALRHKSLFPEITAVSQQMIFQYGSKRKYTLHQPDDLLSKITITQELYSLCRQGILAHNLLPTYWSETFEALNKFIALNQQLTKNNFQSTLLWFKCLTFTAQYMPFLHQLHFFESRLNALQKSVESTMNESTYLLTQTSWGHMLYHYQQYSSNALQSQPKSKKLITYCEIGNKLVPKEYDDAYCEEAIRARHVYRQAMLRLGRFNPTEDPLSTDEYIEKDIQYRTEVSFWAKTQRECKAKRFEALKVDAFKDPDQQNQDFYPPPFLEPKPHPSL